MANEITATATLSMNKGGAAPSRSHTARITMTGSPYVSQVQTIGTSEEALVLGDLGTVGLCWFKNLDGTNYVEIGRLDGGTFRAVAKLKAGEPALFRAGLNALYAKANTASVALEYILLED